MNGNYVRLFPNISIPKGSETRMKVLITCPPMIGMIDNFRHLYNDKEVEIFYPEMVQTLSEDELIRLVPNYDGWIIGDDPTTKRVLEAGKNGLLKAAVKWGVGVDNVDFDAAKELSIPIKNTPNMFGQEVGDVTMSYLTALARKTFLVDREVKAGKWPKPRGISLSGKTMGLVGFGDTGKAIAARALVSEMQVITYTRSQNSQFPDQFKAVQHSVWPERLSECDFIVFACSLTKENWHMLDSEVLNKVKKGVRIVNVARGPLISEDALVAALRSGIVHSVAFDVFEQEPLPVTSALRNFEQCIFGSHNASNTTDAVIRTSERATNLLLELLKIN
jgi:D-3-phosphoglycerate dehydrogenase